MRDRLWVDGERYGQPPSRLSRPSGRWALQAVRPASSRLSACFVTSMIQYRTVPCLSAEQQVYFHQGYEPRDRDLHDMARLREAFGVTTHF